MTDINQRQPGEDEFAFEKSGQYDDDGQPLWRRRRVPATDHGEFRSIGRALADWRVMHPILAPPPAPERVAVLAEELVAEIQAGDVAVTSLDDAGEWCCETQTVLPPFLRRSEEATP